jgi:two-component system LytT family sensor kinase
MVSDFSNPQGDGWSGKTILLHILCWIIFITYELMMVYYVVGNLEKPYIYFVYYLINISFFYGNLRWLNYTFYGLKNKILTGALYYILLIIAFLFFKSLADYLLSNQQFHIDNVFIYVKGFIQRNIFRGLYFTVLATFYWSASHLAFFRRQAMEAEKQQLNVQKEKAQLEAQIERSKSAHLQQQINPHLLFNALNFVYNKVQQHSDDAAQCIWLLAEIMRFSLEPTGPDGKIELARETEQMENLLAINRYRYHEPLHITLVIDVKSDHLRIIPLILLTLTENVFKHGNLTDEANPAMLRLTTDADSRLNFFSRNLKKSTNEHQRRQQLGLQNVRIRLDTAYRGNYQLRIAEPGNFYELSLTLNLCT